MDPDIWIKKSRYLNPNPVLTDLTFYYSDITSHERIWIGSQIEYGS